MKKVLVAVLVMLFWSNVGFALTQDSAISQYLSDRKLEKIEGVWVFQPGGRTIVIYKSNNSYYNKIIWSEQVQSGSTQFNNMRGSSNYFNATASCPIHKADNSGRVTSTTYATCTINIIVRENELSVSSTVPDSIYVRPDSRTVSTTLFRLWPEDLNSHNAKFKTKEDIADEEKVVADMVADAKKTCKVLGFKEESEKFADCTLKLYTQKVDELVAEKKAAADTRMTQSQTSTTTQQSSGSSSVTIYDPVRDSRALMKQGQRMLSGACTFGIDC